MPSACVAKIYVDPNSSTSSLCQALGVAVSDLVLMPSGWYLYETEWHRAEDTDGLQDADFTFVGEHYGGNDLGEPRRFFNTRTQYRQRISADDWVAVRMGASLLHSVPESSFHSANQFIRTWRNLWATATAIEATEEVPKEDV